ncbi:L-lactate dehydrogenase [Breoghania sp.]|uniref:L-lactate dehydrogenase n=1 Tax=Breoghania sp. TaxID=2065378 RepID=UPI002AA88F22|nr:L-lactate dehydrogenase [Breoghania sp.]
MKVGIVGAGMVGSSAAFAIALMGHASSITLVDANEALAKAQAQDISHAVPFASSTRLASGSFDDLKDARIVILAAGASQRPGETRLELLSRNAGIIRSIVTEVLRVAPDAILIAASNPVDVVTQIAHRVSGLPANRVIGSGTILDSARFRSLLGQHLGVSPHSIHAYVLGEHGDSEVLAWSSARAGALPIAQVAAQVNVSLDEAVRAEIDSGVRNAAYTIINGKGSTYYGIGAGLARLVEVIGRSQNVVFSVSSVTEEIEGVRDVALSIPRVLGAGGVVTDLVPQLDETEHAALHRSATILKEQIESLSL